MTEKSRRLTAALSRLWSSNWPATLFAVMGLSVLSYSYGLASYHFETFPFPLVRNAMDAWDALSQLEPDRLPMNIRERRTSDEKDPPVERLSDRAGSEPVLIAGGFYRLLNHCPTHGCLAWVVRRDGEVAHTWEVDPSELLEGAEGFSGRLNDLNIAVAGVRPAKDGAIVVTFQGRNIFPYQIGIAKFDAAGKILWKRFDYSHHVPTIDPSGSIYTAYGAVAEGVEFFDETKTEIHCSTKSILMDGVRILSSDGTVQKDYYLPEIIASSDYPGLMYSVRNGCDPTHLNAVEPVPRAAAEHLPRVEAGDLLLSLREASSLVIIDQHDGALKHTIHGRTSGQHAPRFLPDGDLLVFDNQGGQRAQGGARIVRIDFETNTMTTVFPADDANGVLPFDSVAAGDVAVSQDGSRALISESMGGRVIEIDVETGDPLWIYENLVDLRPFFESQDVETDWTHALFEVKNASYVDDAGFLQED